MENMEILTVIAIIVAPFVGIWAYGKIEDQKKAYERKLDIFKTLMATRGAGLSPEHVNALNRIDVEFNGKATEEKAVRDAWKVYLDHLGSGPQAPAIPSGDADEETRQKYDADYTAYMQDQKGWLDKTNDELANVLTEMGTMLDYDFDKVHIKKAVYQPIAYSTREELQGRLLLALHDVFTGRSALGMHVMNWPESTEEQIALTQALMDSLKDGAHNVRIIADPEPEPEEETPENA